MIPMAGKDCIDNLERLNFAQDPVPRRELRSDYLAVRNLTIERRDELVSPDSKKFDVIIDIVDKLHEQVQLPREQVADAQALLDITKTLVASVMSHSKGETTPEKFITGLIRHFGKVNRPSVNEENAHISLEWKDIGLSVSPILKRALGGCTMLGPMNIEVKQRKAAVRRTKPTTTHLPKEIMMEMVAVGEELMPHRNHTKCPHASEEEPAAYNSPTATASHTPWIRKFTRNHDLVVQEKSTTEEFCESDDAAGAKALRRCKRQLSFDTCVSGSLN